VKLLVLILSDVAPDHPAPDHLGKEFEPAPKAPTVVVTDLLGLTRLIKF
jgi:hypothetical protein